jgi:H+/gluconate symporter-like permease
VSASLFAAITGSSSGALGIVMDAFAKTYLAMGANPDAIHRVAAIASGPLSAMPHSGAVLALLSLMGLTHKEAYRHLFMTNVLGQLLVAVLVIILAVIIY